MYSLAPLLSILHVDSPFATVRSRIAFVVKRSLPPSPFLVLDKDLFRAEIENKSRLLWTVRDSRARSLSRSIDFILLLGCVGAVFGREPAAVVAPIGALLNGTCWMAYNLSGEGADPRDQRSVSRSVGLPVVARVFVAVAVPARAAGDGCCFGASTSNLRTAFCTFPSYSFPPSSSLVGFFVCSLCFVFYLHFMALNYALLLTTFFFLGCFRFGLFFPRSPPTHTILAF